MDVIPVLDLMGGRVVQGCAASGSTTAPCTAPSSPAATRWPWRAALCVSATAGPLRRRPRRHRRHTATTWTPSARCASARSAALGGRGRQRRGGRRRAPRGRRRAGDRRHRDAARPRRPARDARRRPGRALLVSMDVGERRRAQRLPALAASAPLAALDCSARRGTSTEVMLLALRRVGTRRGARSRDAAEPRAPRSRTCASSPAAACARRGTSGARRPRRRRPCCCATALHRGWITRGRHPRRRGPAGDRSPAGRELRHVGEHPALGQEDEERRGDEVGRRARIARVRLVAQLARRSSARRTRPAAERAAAGGQHAAARRDTLLRRARRRSCARSSVSGTSARIVQKRRDDGVRERARRRVQRRWSAGAPSVNVIAKSVTYSRATESRSRAGRPSPRAASPSPRPRSTSCASTSPMPAGRAMRMAS